MGNGNDAKGRGIYYTYYIIATFLSGSTKMQGFVFLAKAGWWVTRVDGLGYNTKPEV